MFSRSNIVIHGGTFNNQNRTSRGLDILVERIATGAFHNSDELSDAPKCHPHTRVAVLDDIMTWVCESVSARDDFMLWLFGPAGAGKSAIAKRIAQMAVEADLLIADFFFSRTSPTRGNKDRLIATLAYQLAVSIPTARPYIEDAIERDPVIFNKTVQNQIITLLVEPLRIILESAQIIPSQKLIIIDGLDECNNSQAQVAILEAISRSFTQYNLPIKFLLVSRPETALVTAFNCKEPLKFIHRRLALDDTYRPYADIHLFFSDKFEDIKLTHPLRSTIPMSWPTQKMLETLVAKSSGQFIYASTVVKFVESSRHRPTARLKIILGISPPGALKPFAELDALFIHLLSSVDDIQLTMRILGLHVVTPELTSIFYSSSMTSELFLSLEPADIQIAIMDLSSILTYDEFSGMIKVLHASFDDFLSDRHRSATFHIDKASVCTDFVRRILQHVKAPDGIRAGDINLFRGVTQLSPWVLKGRLQSDIFDFDLDAFINASIKWRYNKNRPLGISGSTIEALWIWDQLIDASLEDRDRTEALDQLNKSIQLRLQKYQSDWRLQLLVTLAVVDVMHYKHQEVPSCRRLDILLDMDDHDVRRVDRHALDLRHIYMPLGSRQIDMIASHLDHASAALHCMRFLCNPPKYSKSNEYPETGLIYVEWKSTCDKTLEILPELLQQANTSPELVQFVSKYDFHPAVRNFLSAGRVWEVDMNILAFLSRANVCPMIISEIQRSLIITHQKRCPASYEMLYEYEERKLTRHLMRQRLDWAIGKSRAAPSTTVYELPCDGVPCIIMNNGQGLPCIDIYIP